MAKKIQGSDGKTYVVKRPFYKRVWFWLIVVVLLVISFSSIGSNSSSSKSTSTSTTTNTNSSSKKPNVPTSYISALHKAQSYSDNMHMSKQGIYDQLTSDYGEQFKPEAAQYAIDHVKANWNKNALKKAKSYQKNMDMSPEAIRDQLTSSSGEQFTQEEANYAVNHLPE